MHSSIENSSVDTRDLQGLSDSALYNKARTFVQEQSDGEWDATLENEDATKLVEVVKEIVEPLATQIKVLQDALRKWSCPSCGGSGIFKWQKTEVECKICRGHGLHPEALAALWNS